jgi:replicative DNA helicase Mcm
MTATKSATGAPISLRLSGIRNEHVGNVITFPVRVLDVEQNMVRIVMAAFECLRCGNVTHLPQDRVYNRFVEPETCSCDDYKKSVFRLLDKESELEDYQVIHVYEERKKDKLKVFLYKDVIGTVSPGDNIVITGRLMSKRGRGSAYEYYVDANNVVKVE